MIEQGNVIEENKRRGVTDEYYLAKDGSLRIADGQKPVSTLSTDLREAMLEAGVRQGRALAGHGLHLCLVGAVLSFALSFSEPAWVESW